MVDGLISDEELVRRCQTGDFTAFEEIYRRYQRPILAYIYQITRNYDESGSIAQDVFLTVFEHVDRFDLSRRFSTWFYTIARNAAIDYLHARGRKAMVSFADFDRDDEAISMVASTSSFSAPVGDRLTRGEAKEKLASALAELPQMYREIVELVVFQEKTYEEASLILGGISLGTLRSRMFHALRRLRESLLAAGGSAGDDLF